MKKRTLSILLAASLAALSVRTEKILIPAGSVQAMALQMETQAEMLQLGTENGSVQASGMEDTAGEGTETEPKAIMETGTELETRPEVEIAAGIAAESETEPGAETESEIGAGQGIETEPETAIGPETIPGTGIETEPGADPGTEIETEAGTDPGTEMETETGSEAETGAEAETETEKVTEAETEAESGTETEPEQRWKIIVSDIRLAPGFERREYDATDRTALLYEISIERTDGKDSRDPAPGEEFPAVRCSCALAGKDAGEWDVNYSFYVEGAAEETYELSVQETKLRAVIEPKSLSLELPDGWKRYGEKAVLSNIHLEGELSVSGFVRNAQGKECIPEDFRMPVLMVDSKMLGTFSPMWKKGKRVQYEGALSVKKKDGSWSGNAGTNYRFAQDRLSGGRIEIRPGKIREGMEYTVFAPDGALRAGEDTWYVRGGGSLLIQPVPGSGYDRGAVFPDITREERQRFALSSTDENGEEEARSQETELLCIPDFEAPKVQIQVAGGKQIGGKVYSGGLVTVSFRTPEDTGSGLAAARCRIEGGDGVWQEDCLETAVIELTQEGVYQADAVAQDRVGNEAHTGIQEIILDRTMPEIEISGLQEGSANSGEITCTIRAMDAHYRAGSLRAYLDKAFGDRIYLPVEDAGDHAQTAKLAGIPADRGTDGIYTLHVQAEDLAGNLAQEEISFSVNRFGSAYSIGKQTRTALETYYHTRAFPVIFLEQNIDRVGQAQLYVRHSGELELLEQGRDYSVEAGGSWGNRRYTYEVPEKYFRKEGTYEVLLLSEYPVGNTADTVSGQKAVRFAIDRTPPDILIAGAQDQAVYETDMLWLSAQVRDEVALDYAALYLNGALQKVYPARELAQSDGELRWKLERSEDWQKVRIAAFDAAGNSSGQEAAFYIAGAGTDPETARKAAQRAERRENEAKRKKKEAAVKEETAAKREAAAQRHPGQADAGTAGRTGEEKDSRTDRSRGRERLLSGNADRKVSGGAAALGAVLLCALLTGGFAAAGRHRRRCG